MCAYAIVMHYMLDVVVFYRINSSYMLVPRKRTGLLLTEQRQIFPTRLDFQRPQVVWLETSLIGTLKSDLLYCNQTTPSLGLISANQTKV